MIVCPRLEYGCCVLRLRGGSHLQRPLFRDTDRNWELHATPSWWEPPPKSLSLYVSHLGAHHSSHMPLGHVYGVYEMMAFGPATSMPIIWLFFSSYTWIEIVHDSEGSLFMDHDLGL